LTQGGQARLSELQATLAELIGDRGVLAGTVADAQGWVFILYTGDTAWLPAFEAQFRAAASDHQVGFVVFSLSRSAGGLDLTG
jgi:hypothetical protein